MIKLENVSKSFSVRGRRKVIFQDLNLTIPSGRSIALLGPNGAGKSTLLGMISGLIPYDKGRILRKGSVSWPVGFAGSLHPDLSGAQNVRFVARVYGVDTAYLEHFTQGFTELGPSFYNPLRSYSAGMKARLAFGLSMGIKFDTYLIDEVTAVGDRAFNRKSRALFRDRMQNAGAIVVSHQTSTIRDYCDCALYLENGGMTFYENVDEGLAKYEGKH